MTDGPTIAAMNSDRTAFRRIARVGFVLAPAMFLLPLIHPLVTQDVHPVAIICMTAAWAVLVSACSFAAMAHTRPGGHPWVHQAWATPVALVVMVPGGLVAVIVQGLLLSALHQASV